MELTVRAGKFITSDDIKQLRTLGRISSEHVKRMSSQLWLYDRNYLLSDEFKPPVKKRNYEIKVERVVKWLEYPETIARIEAEGLVIPFKQEAQELKKANAATKGRGGRKKVKTNS